jgi:hypothetical protein
MAKRSNAVRSKLRNKTTPAQAPAQRRRAKTARTKSLSAQRNAARTSIDRERKPTAEARKGASNSELPASLENNTVSLDRAEGARIRSGSSEALSRSTSIFWQFYELSRVRVALAQLSAQKLQRSFAAFIGCRSPQEFFQLQNQLVKEQLELLAASIYGPFLNEARQPSTV